MRQYFATVARGLENLAAEELTQLGGKAVEPGFCGVAFRGDQELMYRVNLWSRLAFRVLLQLGDYACDDADVLYDSIQRIDWQTMLPPDKTLAVDVTGKNRRLNHSHFTALQVKNAIVDQQRQQWGERSSVDSQQPDVRVNVHIHGDRCIVSLDSSGHSLHRRGYRAAVGTAPLKESLAAALVKMTGWPGTVPLLDPLCGSGTLPLEAALAAMNVAPGLFAKQFGLQTWPDFDAALWRDLHQSAQQQRRQTLEVPVWGCDRDDSMIQQAQANAQHCGLQQQVHFFQQTLDQLEPPADSGYILCNPPYGQRLGDKKTLSTFYKQLGDVLKQRFKGWTAFILSGNKDLAKYIGLKSALRTWSITARCPASG
jgi:putative N6-adenine-specific DNA methylase